MLFYMFYRGLKCKPSICPGAGDSRYIRQVSIIYTMFNNYFICF